MPESYLVDNMGTLGQNVAVSLQRIAFLHLATLDALSVETARKHASLAFAGGTALHLAWGSPRWSEDLDFITADVAALPDLMQAVHRRVADALIAEYGLRADLFVSDGTLSGRKAERGRPLIWELRVQVPRPQTKPVVKVEFMPVPAGVLTHAGVTGRRLEDKALPTTSVVLPTVALDFVFGAKLHAVGGRLGARGRIKVRDVFDLAWIGATFGRPGGELDRQKAYQSAIEQAALYPDRPGCEEAAPMARAALAVADRDAVASELRKFVPARFATNEAVAEMLRTADDELARFEQAMQQAVDRPRSGMSLR